MTARPGHVQRLAETLAGPPDAVHRVVLIAPDGAGRTEALDALAELLGEREIGFVRITGRRADRNESLRALREVLADDIADERAARDALRGGLGEDRTLLVLDDAHWADDASLRVLAALVEESDELGVVATHRPVPSEGLSALDAAMARRGEIVRIEALTVDDVAERASAALGSPVQPELADELHARTGGNARLVDRLTADASDARVPPALVESVRGSVGELSPEARDALTTLCLATAVDDELLAAVVGIDQGAVRDVFAELAGAGFLLPGHDEPIPVVADAVAAGQDAATARGVHRRIAELLGARGAPATQVAEHLVAGGARGGVAAEVLAAAGRAVLPEAPAEAVRLLDDAAQAGADADSLAGLRAEANALAGDEERALSLAHTAGGTPESTARATIVLGGLLARRGLWGRAAQAYRSVHEHPTLPPDAIAGLAAVCAVATGHPVAPVVLDDAPANLSADIARLLGRSARCAGEGDADGALEAADEAAELVAVTGSTVVLPETPHAIGATVALATGDVDNATRLIALAVDVVAGGPAATPRHHLLGGLASLRAGQWDRVNGSLEAAGDATTTRDAFLAGALRVGLARRVGDVGGLHEAWDAVSGPLAAVRGDLFLLLPIAEIVVAAGRLGRRDQTRARERELGAVVEALGGPALWARPLAWAGVEAAIAADDLGGLESAAAALASVASAHERLEGLDVAAAAWRAVLVGETIPAGVLDEGVAALERAGLVWEASRLVGQAAIRSGDPRETRALLGRARDLKGTLPVVDELGVPVGTVLSAREQEVASGVLDGLTHKEIGAILFISPKTVEHHVARIRQKLGASTRAEMLAGLRATLDST